MGDPDGALCVSRFICFRRSLSNFPFSPSFLFLSFLSFLLFSLSFCFSCAPSTNTSTTAHSPEKQNVSDGDCNGDEFREGNRLATIVIYCEVPTIGGATNFAKSNLHIVPTKGSATWFTYVGTAPSDLPSWPAYGEGGELVVAHNDDHYSEHSGCPVIEGEKKIVTQWMRKGVTEESPWDSFNTMGVKKSVASDLLKKAASQGDLKEEL